jgi:hypothetical protein
MRRLVLTLAPLVVSVAGCSLDIGRLYGDAEMLDGGSDAPPADVGMDAAGLDVGDAPVVRDDVPTDAPVSPLQLSVRDSYSLGSGGMDVATSIAAGRASGETRIAVSAAGSGAMAILGVTGSGCDLRLAPHRTRSSGYPGPVAVGTIDNVPGLDVIAGAGPGTLTAFVGPDASLEVPSPHDFGSLAAIDLGTFDGEANLDVLLIENGPGARVGRGDAAGHFGAYGDPGDLTGTLDGAFGYLGTDGALDVLRIVSEAGGTRLALTQGTTTGFLTTQTIPVHEAATRLAVGRVDPASDPSVFVVGGTSATVVTWDMGLAPRGPFTVATDARDVVVADLDGASPREVVVSDGTSGNLHVLSWDGVGLEELATFPIFGVPTGMAAVDADGDGDDELLVLVGNGVQLLSTGCDP